MKLKKLTIEGFRRHLNTEILMSNATFLIGENNVGKSSVLSALELLLSDKKKISNDDFYHICDSSNNNCRYSNKVVITAEFDNLPDVANTWVGFKGRCHPYYEDGIKKNKIFFRKTYEPNKDYTVEIKEFVKNEKTEFSDCKTVKDYINLGLNKETIIEILNIQENDIDKKVTNAEKNKIRDVFDEIYEYGEDVIWFKNPGGIPGNVLSKLPKVLIIPAQDKTDEMTGKNGALITTLNELFNDVRDQSSNFKEAQKFLNRLAEELDPSNSNSEFGKMMDELNMVLGEVFPKAGIHTIAKLSEADKVINPQFNVTMSSNINTPVELQGTGAIRAAVFALLRYRANRENKQSLKIENYNRHLIIGFEEPEIYLHPNAAQQLRETLYLLASSENNQIVCTTHSPYMIDLSQKPNQILNLLSLQEEQKEYENDILKLDIIKSNPFNVSQAYNSLISDERDYIKMLLKIDDYVAKVFFAKKVLIIEGDTEELVLRESIKLLEDKQKTKIYQEWQFVKARGKASIIALVKYLKAVGVNPYVMHDLDLENENAAIFNEPIKVALGNCSHLITLENCIEDVLGYTPPSYDKPFKAFKYISNNWKNESMIPSSWMSILNRIFNLN